MAQDIEIISVDQASELAGLLSEADTHPVVLTTGTASYRVTREDAHTNATSFNAVIDRLAGSWSPDDADAALEYIYKAREEGSRPATRP
jgi:hypothetical protein